MNKKGFENKKFRIKIFKTKCYSFEIKEPYQTNKNFTDEEINRFIEKYSPFVI